MMFACEGAKKTELELEVKVTLNGKPASQAKVFSDGQELGTTDGNGYFSKRIQKQPGAEVQVSVRKEETGYRIEPWKGSFVVKLPKEGTVDTYPFKVSLKGTKYITIVVLDDEGDAVEDATIRIQKKERGKSNDSGEFVYDYKRVPKRGINLRVSKSGYSTYRGRVKVEPGQTIDVTLSQKGKTVAVKKEEPEEEPAEPEPKPEPVAKKEPAPEKQVEKPVKKSAPKTKKVRASLTVSAMTDFYGIKRAVRNIAVYVNGKRMGKTNKKGVFVYKYRGKPGQEIELKFKAPGYIPAEVEQTVAMSGKKKILQMFYPATPKPIKVGIYGYVNNTPEEDLSNVLTKVEDLISNNLFVYSSFREVQKQKLRDKMLKIDLDLETATTKGWQKTSLIWTLDMIVAGSVAKTSSGYNIETTVTTSKGDIIFSQINKARDEQSIGKICKVIVKSIVTQFPFEGAVVANEEDGFRINLSKDAYMVRRGNIFNYMAVDTYRNGNFKGYHEAGKLRVVKTDSSSSWAEVVSLDETQELKPGSKVVRRIYLEEEKETAKATVNLFVTGGIAPNESKLWGVNVYLNNTWVGTTASNGKVQIPVNLFEDYELLLSRQGYQQLRESLNVDDGGQTKEYNLEVASALLKAESEPSEATVFVDDVELGVTPIVDGKPVTFGFRKIRLSVGGDYRDWQKIMEFNKPEVELTGENMVVFVKDYLKIGKRAEESRNYDAAIEAYSKTEKGNPDYSDAHHRLAQLYMDEKNDYANAIREFENVLSLPENRQIIYKQFAVTYTNLGHAYYEKGNSMIREDKINAARNFAKAIEKLNKARQNTRFFPNDQFHEAVHDTYYYRAISYHKLYLVTKKKSVLRDAKQAWREYFDFFPKQLEGKSSFMRNRSAAKKYWKEIKNLR